MEYRIDDLLDEYFDTSVSLETMEYTSADAIKELTVNRIKTEGRSTRRLWKPGVLLAAVVAATLLIGTAVASCVTYMHLREVEDSAETIWYSYVESIDEYQRVYWPNAQYAVDLEIPEDAKSQENMVYYRLNWLPSEPCEYMFGNIREDGWIPFNVQTWEDLGGTIPYQINVTTIQEHEYDKVYYLNGATTLVKQDNWNGWNRMELTVDYTGTDGLNALHWEEAVNYLLLYDPEENIFINICGMMDLDTFEKIAEYMEIMVSDEPYKYADVEPNPNHVGTPAGILDLARG